MVTDESSIEDILAQMSAEMGPDCILGRELSRQRRAFVRVARDCLLRVASRLHEAGFTHLSTITGQELDGEVELIYHLINAGTHVGLRVRLPLDSLSVPTMTALIPGAVLYEREVHEMLGVNFEGHPDLSRLILPEEWDLNTPPLRKQTPSVTGHVDVTPRKRSTSAQSRRRKPADK
ncbi:MAG: NADH-quinone oxidoreductase subunit C [Candidatus Thorarchaeota archaeon]